MPETILPDHGREHQYRGTAGSRSTLEPPPRGGCPGWKRNPELHALGRAILELRARRGLSQEQLGHRAGLHRNYVGALERGEINTTFRVLLKLCTGLRLPLAELVDVFERQRGTLGPYRPPASGTDR